MVQEIDADKEKQSEMRVLFETWTEDPGNIMPAFTQLRDAILAQEKAAFSFTSRPGISHSFRGCLPTADEGRDRLFVMVDIVDDDPENRWLSVCFYGDAITDPDELGDLIPGGLLGEDGYCFDLYEYDEGALSYLKERIDEAHQNALIL